MLEIHPLLLLYQGAIFIIFAFLMWKFVYKSLVKMVEDRRRRIEQTILDAEKKQGEADALRLGYEGKVAELNARADDIIRKAEAEAYRRRDDIVEQARTEAAKIAERNRVQCETDVEEAMLSAKSELLDIAGSMARRALSRAATPEVDARLVEELNQELRQTAWKN
jgi:F-type H+-transporting ATPase subunit b